MEHRTALGHVEATDRERDLANDTRARTRDRLLVAVLILGGVAAGVSALGIIGMFLIALTAALLG